MENLERENLSPYGRSLEGGENNIEADIEKLLGELYGFQANYESLSADWQTEWYYAEMEADSGMDRKQVKDNLKKFVDDLARIDF